MRPPAKRDNNLSTGRRLRAARLRECSWRREEMLPGCWGDGVGDGCAGRGAAVMRRPTSGRRMRGTRLRWQGSGGGCWAVGGGCGASGARWGCGLRGAVGACGLAVCVWEAHRVGAWPRGLGAAVDVRRIGGGDADRWRAAGRGNACRMARPAVTMRTAKANASGPGRRGRGCRFGAQGNEPRARNRAGVLADALARRPRATAGRGGSCAGEKCAVQR